MEAEQPGSADAAVVVNASEVGLPAAKVEAAEKPASKAPARSTRAAVPAAKMRLSSKCAPVPSLPSAWCCRAMNLNPTLLPPLPLALSPAWDTQRTERFTVKS